MFKVTQSAHKFELEALPVKVHKEGLASVRSILSAFVYDWMPPVGALPVLHANTSSVWVGLS